MLSIMILSAIVVIALPKIRVTALSIVRLINLAYPILCLYVVLIATIGMIMNIEVLNSITFDILGIYIIIVVFVMVYFVQCFYTQKMVSAYSMPYVIGILTSIIVVGAYLLIVSDDIIAIVISLELQSFSVYAITAVYRWREGATSAGLIYFILGAFSSGLVLLGLSMMYSYGAVISFSDITSLSQIVNNNDNALIISILVLISGILFKVTAAPFHYWAPDVYDRVPTITTIFISLIPKLAIIVFIIRVSGYIIYSHLDSLINVVVVLSWTFGSIVGLVQTRIKRLLAYSTVSHVGWILIAITIGGTIGFGSLMFYLSQYSITTALTFQSLIAISITNIGLFNNQSNNTITNDGDIELISTMNGLYKHSILFTLIMVVTLFSAAGVPPMIGFYAKLSVIQAILFNGQYIWVALGIISSIISAGFYLSVISSILFKTTSQ